MAGDGGFYDVYVLSPGRTATIAATFLAEFAPDREQSASDYALPNGLVEQDAAKAIAVCVADPAAEEAFYFRVLSPGPSHAMLFFNSDGTLVLGLSVEDDPRGWFAKLKTTSGAVVGYMTFEESPPRTADEFQRIAISLAKCGFGLDC